MITQGHKLQVPPLFTEHRRMFYAALLATGIPIPPYAQLREWDEMELAPWGSSYEVMVDDVLSGDLEQYALKPEELACFASITPATFPAAAPAMLCSS
jgi:hypothetical protein